MNEVEKLHGLHNTGMTMHERFTLLTRQPVGRRGKMYPRQVNRFPRARGKGRTNPALLEAIINQLNQAQRPIPEIPFHNRGRGGGSLRRYGSEGNLRSLPGLRRERSNSFGHMDHANKDQRWRRSNGNLSNYAGSVNGSVYSLRSGASRGYWLRGDAAQRRGARGGARGRARGRAFRGRVQFGRVHRVVESGRPARGSGRRGARRNLAPGGRGPGRARARGFRARGRGRGGISHNQTPKPVPTKEDLDAQLDQYMASSVAALDKELDEYMSNAIDLE